MSTLYKASTSSASSSLPVPGNPNLADDVLAWAVGRMETWVAVVDGAFAGRAAPILDGAGGRFGVTIPLGGPVVGGSCDCHR